MEYTTLGSTGMSVSKICLGCMSFGSGEPWMLEGEDTEALIERAIDLTASKLSYLEEPYEPQPVMAIE